MEDSKHFGEPRLRQSSPVLAASNEMESAAGNGTQVDLPKAFATKSTEERDPLRDDQILLQGLRIAEPGDDGANTIRKVPSDQTVSMFRWGTTHRTTGRSRTGLQIMVPGREAVGPVSVADGGPFSGKSIIYTYVSSSSSSGRTMNSFGAVGDHLQSARTGSLSSGRLSVLLEDQPDKSAEKYSGAHPKGQSPLADLMVDSIPDQDPYKLLIVGETGPCRQHTAPYFISPSEFPLLPSRRRSLSDLVENQKGVVPSKTGDEDSSCPESQTIAVPASLPQQENNESRLECPAEPPGFEGGKAPESRETQMFAASTKVHPEEMSNFGLDGPAEPQDFERGADVLGPPAVPVWHRAGPPFQLVRRQETKRAVLTTPINVDFDPATFQLPLGSKIYLMKVEDVPSLRASVATGVWSSSPGVNQVLQKAWEDKQADEKIVLLFSIPHHSRPMYMFSGMAEMGGPFDPNADPRTWIKGLKDMKGVIPVHWIVAKDVEFSVFDHLKHNSQRVTETRNANVIPGKAGIRLLQTYFECEHASTALIHPDKAVPYAPVRRRKRRPKNTQPLQDVGPYRNDQPSYRPVMESADERYPPFSHSGYGEPSYPPSAPHPGYPLTYDTFQPGFAPTGSLTDAWMFDPTYGGGPPFQWP